MKTHNSLNALQRIAVGILWGLCYAVALTPYWFRYRFLQDVIYWVLYKCCRYRVRVVNENLRRSFPEMSSREIRDVRRKFYMNLSEIIVDTVSLARMSDAECRRRVRIRDLDALLRAVEGRNVIFTTAHYGCWEYTSFLCAYTDSHYIAAVYHRLASAVMDELFLRLRMRRNMALIPMKEIIRYFILNHRDGNRPGRPVAIGLIADQNPPRRPNSHWFRFLGQDTLFFDGTERMALKFGLPVYFCRFRRVKRGFYESEFVRIYDGRETVAPNEITERYVRELESEIRENPGMWLWSHRRWKHRR